MANEEQLSILKQGVEAWNRWREDNPAIKIDLLRADIGQAMLEGADLWLANLMGANLFYAELSRANLIEANLMRANLIGANLREANLVSAKFTGAHLANVDLAEADLRDAQLVGADLTEADLTGANLTRADLWGANLRRANLKRANLLESKIGATEFGNIDLSDSLGLEKASHSAPSTIGTDTIKLSRGKIPLEFLRGCGLSDWEIEHAELYIPDLSNERVNEILYKMYELRAAQAIQFSPLFVPYSHADSEFVDKIGDCLTDTGIRYWRDIHAMISGRIEKQIDRAIELNPTVLLILSKHSLKSDWVEHEVRKARKLEKKLRRDVLCPVALDNSWKEKNSWPGRIMEQVTEYNILDFSEWQDDSKFKSMFRKLIDGLELFYKG
jgi:uncharacterized protein YjbI with pentapeptide repeats